MDEILDNLEDGKDEEVIKTKWFPVFCFGLVYAIYAYLKFDIITPFIFKFIEVDGYVNTLISILLLVSYILEFLLCIIFLRRYEYLSYKEIEVFLVCYLYSILGYTIYYLVHHIHLGLNVIVFEFGLGAIFICIISTPFIIIADKIIDYIKQKELKNNE